VIDVAKAKLEKTLSYERMLTCVRFSPCGTYAVAGSVDARVVRWDLKTGARTALEGHRTWVAAVAFLGDRLLSADLQGRLICRDAWAIEAPHAEWLRALAVHPDGTRFATGGHDRVARLWSADGKLVREFAGHKGYVFSLAFHPDGRSLVTGDLFGTVRHWDLESGKLIREFDLKVLHSRGEEFLADVGGVRSLAFDAAGKRLACSGLREAKSNTFCPGLPTVVVLDWETGERRQLGVKEDKVDGAATRVRFLSDGTVAATGEGQSQGALWFWKESPDPVHALSGQSMYDLDIHPDGGRLAAAVFEAKGRGGNGRHAGRAEYVPNAGAVRLWSL